MCGGFDLIVIAKDESVLECASQPETFGRFCADSACQARKFEVRR